MKRFSVLYLGAIAAAVLVQGFQCGSADMTTARRAIQQKDFTKAKQSLNNALALNPDNVDAMILLASVYDGLEQSDSSALTYQRALGSPSIKPEQREVAGVTLFQQWAAAYNKGIKVYSEAMSSKGDSAKLREALSSFESALRIRPEYTDIYANVGETSERLGDTNRAMQAYASYYAAEKTAIEVLTASGVTLGSTRGQMIKALGTPKNTKMDSLDKGVLYGDAYVIGGKRAILFSYTESSEDAVVEGWRYDPPATLIEKEIVRPRIVSVGPLKNAAYIEYTRGRYAEALQWADIVAKVKPEDKELTTLRGQAMTRSGKAEQAISELTARIAKDVSAVQPRVELMAMYTNTERYDDALRIGEEVLALEPNNEAALFECAANAKNVAGLRQQQQFELMDKNPKHVMDTTYMSYLTRSAGYFERLRKVSARYKDDFGVIADLANTYEVRKDVAKVNALIGELEALEVKYANDPNYYRVMEGLYARNKMMDKMKDAQAKGAKINGK
jgi:tetratricopeptide (TPR) repeat protein